MMSALDSSQSALGKVLRRMVTAGVLTVRRGHVQGERLRLKIYVLTPLGETLARDMKRRGGGAT
jgi:DNA-binding PadR family transcriptional regulator